MVHILVHALHGTISALFINGAIQLKFHLLREKYCPRLFNNIPTLHNYVYMQIYVCIYLQLYFYIFIYLPVYSFIYCCFHLLL